MRNEQASPVSLVAGRAGMELEIPGLAHQIAAEAVPLLAGDAAKAGRGIEAPGGDEDILRPQGELGVAALAGEFDAFGNQPLADAQAAGAGLDQQQTQLRRGRRGLYDKGTADPHSLALGDPATLPLGIEIAQERGGNLRNERLQARVEAIFTGVTH